MTEEKATTRTKTKRPPSGRSSSKIIKSSKMARKVLSSKQEEKSRKRKPPTCARRYTKKTSRLESRSTSESSGGRFTFGEGNKQMYVGSCSTEEAGASDRAYTKFRGQNCPNFPYSDYVDEIPHWINLSDKESSTCYGHVRHKRRQQVDHFEQGRFYFLHTTHLSKKRKMCLMRQFLGRASTFLPRTGEPGVSPASAFWRERARPCPGTALTGCGETVNGHVCIRCFFHVSMLTILFSCKDFKLNLRLFPEFFRKWCLQVVLQPEPSRKNRLMRVPEKNGLAAIREPFQTLATLNFRFVPKPAVWAYGSLVVFEASDKITELAFPPFQSNHTLGVFTISLSRTFYDMNKSQVCDFGLHESQTSILCSSVAPELMLQSLGVSSRMRSAARFPTCRLLDSSTPSSTTPIPAYILGLLKWLSISEITTFCSKVGRLPTWC
ncbi:hypothetical protein SELMODRAFT_411643 [Selaginella moellendorffii]|uniref:Uncharacterized protein n=1 Tax=Selaginella moellendorffii TaxID=88036 RepID=D8RIK5_SELML|nr:hypothetical protein SELMODRAFT_411643 [Selaginella moellendorffii]